MVEVTHQFLGDIEAAVYGHRERLADVMFHAMIGVDEKTRLAAADAILKVAVITWKPHV